jgi:hypothetical protein
MPLSLCSLRRPQVIAENVQANPERKRRFIVWLFLEIIGPASVLLAWGNIYVGIVVYHKYWGAPYAPWIVPIAIVMGLLVRAREQVGCHERGDGGWGLASEASLGWECVGGRRREVKLRIYLT